MDTAQLSVPQAADELGVAPARVRALLSSGALRPAPDAPDAVLAEDAAALLRRGAVRAVDVAAVEGALDRALRRRLPALLDAGVAAALDAPLRAALEPLSGEVATALADVEISTQRLLEAERRAELSEAATTIARGQVAALEAQVAELEQQVAALQAQPVGLFRRRRRVAAGGVATA